MRLVFQLPASMTSVVDAPRLVSSDASPTRPEWAVTCSTPAALAAAWNRSPTSFGESDTTRSSGAGLAATRNVSIARATSPFTNRTWRYKEQAIQRAASAFRRALGTDPLSSLVFVPIPLYDDRVTRMLRAIGPDGTVDVRELIIQTKSTDAVHSRQTRPTPPQIQDQYRIDEALTISEPAFIAIVDDVLTTGAHFRAASAVLTARFPAVRIVGLFIPRRVPGAERQEGAGRDRDCLALWKDA